MHTLISTTGTRPGIQLNKQVRGRFATSPVPAEGNGDLHTLICVPVARPRRCLTLSNPVPWQNWMAAYLGSVGCTLRMRTLFRGWPIMVNDTHTRRRRRSGHWQVTHSGKSSPESRKECVKWVWPIRNLFSNTVSRRDRHVLCLQ